VVFVGKKKRNKEILPQKAKGGGGGNDEKGKGGGIFRARQRGRGKILNPTNHVWEERGGGKKK